MSTKNHSSFPAEVVNFRKAVEAAQAIEAQTKIAEELKAEIGDLEKKVLDAPSDAEALKVASTLGEKRAQLEVRTLRAPRLQEEIAAAWRHAYSFANRAGDAVTALTRPLSERAQSAVSRIVVATAAPEIFSEQYHATPFAAGRDQAFSTVALLARVSRTIRTEFTARSFTSKEDLIRLLPDIESELAELAGNTAEVERLEKAAEAVEAIFSTPDLSKA